MRIEELTNDDADVVVELWRVAELTRPWNDPVADFRRAIAGATSTVLAATSKDQLIGAVMVGHDGHRGWVYYLAVRADQRRCGVGAALMGAAEAWLRERGCVKLQLMLRRENDVARSFYERINFEVSDVTVYSRRLVAPE
jgi:ribosomal protein S18 acetylase RimI-like enzyme